MSYVQKQPPEVFCKKGVLRNLTKFTGKHLCQNLFFPQACNLIKKETLAQVFSCELCEIFEITFFTEHLWTIASLQCHWLHWKSYIGNSTIFVFFRWSSLWICYGARYVLFTVPLGRRGALFFPGRAGVNIWYHIY